jgi:aminoglycoside phosphotransferase (APT) family kinase protein
MTLLHGDYWPGNINVHSDGSLTVYDWEKAAIGPPILDLLNFVKASFWWFEPLPISQEEIVDHYRTRIKLANGYIWKQAEWEALWDYAKLWTFMTQWLDLLATIPDSVLESRIEHLETAWLKPVMEAAERRLPRA